MGQLWGPSLQQYSDEFPGGGIALGGSSSNANVVEEWTSQ